MGEWGGEERQRGRKSRYHGQERNEEWEERPRIGEDTQKEERRWGGGGRAKNEMGEGREDEGRKDEK
jgi:hypothetical protein